MKQLIFCITMLLASSISINAQNVVREGNTFKVVAKSAETKRDTLLTSYTLVDSKGLQYPIIVNKVSGRCWVWKLSSKSGKMYKYYLNEEISRAVCKELGITYVPKTKK